MKVITETHRAN